MKKAFLILLLFVDLAFNSHGQSRPTAHLVQGGSVTLHAHAEGALSFLWFKDNEPINGFYEEKLVVQEAGIYTVIALNGGCESEISDPVEVIIEPHGPDKQVDMQIAKSASRSVALLGATIDYQLVVVNKGPHTATDLSVRDILPPSLEFNEILGPYSGAVSYSPSTHELTWKPDSLSPGKSAELRIRTQTKREGTVENYAEVEATQPDPDIGNNAATASTNVVALRIPNAFSPNGDGLNDVFEITGLELFEENELFIFNRWGAEVYQMRNYRNTWNGGTLNEGTYYYVLRIKMETGKMETFKGYVTLIKQRRFF